MRRCRNSFPCSKMLGLLLFAVFKSGVSQEVKCVHKLEENINFELTTKRNETGHWIAKVQLHRDRSDKDGEYNKMERPVEVHVTKTSNACYEQTGGYDVVLTTSPTITPSPGPDYRFFPGYGYYKRHMEKKSWMDAKLACAREGSHLVIINSADEAILMMELSARHILGQKAETWNSEAYVGISDDEHEGNFHTIFGLPLEDTGYISWAPGEPNNYSEEDCISILRNMQYNDRDCDTKLEFICELEI